VQILRGDNDIAKERICLAVLPDMQWENQNESISGYCSYQVSIILPQLQERVQHQPFSDENAD
jgi:hypothetical protein